MENIFIFLYKLKIFLKFFFNLEAINLIIYTLNEVLFFNYRRCGKTSHQARKLGKYNPLKYRAGK